MAGPCSSPEARQFDFWLGEWDLTWPADQSGGNEGEIGTGHNEIRRMYGDCVIEENFTTDDGSFRGHSVSVYDERARLWRQTWVDSSGGYLVFTGSFADNVMTLATEPVERDDETVVQRMVFSEIEEGSLQWAWQGSRDGGATWNDLWNISYRRRA
ncbi:MAG: DUF1579 family protein [Acidimicrobiia bacterium]|jgi:hypothetical protein